MLLLQKMDERKRIRIKIILASYFRKDIFSEEINFSGIKKNPLD